jgi:hypothetical protein
MVVFSKTGSVRIAIQQYGMRAATTTAEYIVEEATSWTDTANQLVSIDIVSSQAGGIGIDSELELWCRRITA